MTIRLIVRVPRGTTTDVSDHSFTRREVVVGRSPECDLVLPGDEVRVSRQHIRIVREDSGYRMYDLGSRNGTLLNNNLIEPKSDTILNASDTIKMGSVEVQVAGIKLTNPDKETKTRTRNDPKAAAALRALEGISDHFLGASDFETEQQVILFGEMIRMALDQVLEGLYQMLTGRREFEQEFDAFVSMVMQREANPIKQKAELNEFKRFPLDWREAPELSVVKDSIARAVRDVGQHQTGMMAGMQQVLDSIIDKMNPKKIEEAALEEASFLGRMSADKTAWRHYCSIYKEFLTESSKLFNEMIYPNLQKGYLLSHEDKTAIYTTAAKLSKEAMEESVSNLASEENNEEDAND